MNLETIHNRPSGDHFVDIDDDGDVVLYLTPELVSYRVRIETEDKKRVNLAALLQQSGQPGMVLWEKGLKDLAGVITAMSFRSGYKFPVLLSSQMETGILIGTLLERFRINRGAKISIDVARVTAETYDAALKKVTSR